MPASPAIFDLLQRHRGPDAQLDTLIAALTEIEAYQREDGFDFLAPTDSIIGQKWLEGIWGWTWEEPPIDWAISPESRARLITLFHAAWEVGCQRPKD